MHDPIVSSTSYLHICSRIEAHIKTIRKHFIIIAAAAFIIVVAALHHFKALERHSRQLATYLHNNNKYFYDLDQRTTDTYLSNIFD